MHWSYFAGEYPILQSKLGNRMMISVAKKKFEGMYRSKSQSDNLGFKLNFNLNINNAGYGNTFKIFKGNNNINMNNTSNQFNQNAFKKLNPLQKSQYINKSKQIKKNSVPYFVKGNYNSNNMNNNSNSNSALFGNTNMKINQGLGNLLK